MRASTCVIFNPTARGEKARHFRRHLQELAADCVLRPTTGPGAATHLAREAVAAGFETVVAAGGDGTVSEVVDGLATAPGGLEHTRLGIIPLGTINVFARELALPTRLGAAWTVVRTGAETRVDLPEVEFTEAGQPRRRAFAQLAGAGLDSRAIAQVDFEWKKRVGPLAYVVGGLEAMRGPQPVLSARGDHHAASGELVLIGNGRLYGGSVQVFDQADLRDGRLDVRVFPRVTALTLVRFGVAWLARRPLPGRGAIQFQATTLSVTSDSPMPFELDGDNAGPLPARFTVRREVLRVIVPRRPGP